MRLFQPAEALTFDDVLLVPAHSTVVPKDVSVATRLTRGIRLNIPLVSAAMDTVTEGRLVIALALEGGIGIVHKNMTAEQQAVEVRRVKKYESGVLREEHAVPVLEGVREAQGSQERYSRLHEHLGGMLVSSKKTIPRLGAS